MIVTERVSGTAGKSHLKKYATRSAWLLMIMISLVLLITPFVFKLDGKPHADWQQFVGRFHPLAVHIPIGLIVLIPLLEIAGRWRPALREAAGFVLFFACVACLATLALGYLLAYGSGDTGSTVTRHMWGGIALTITLLLSALMRPAWSAGVSTRAYPALLICAQLALLWTAHQGGSLTHGGNYLTEFMPAPLKRVIAFPSVGSSVPNPDAFYAQHIHPVFDSHCVACHGAEKSQGGLRLDSYDALMRGGKTGPVIVPRHPDQSLLLTRVTLPSTDKHFMPAEGRPPLKPEEIAWLRAWIEQGASPTAKSLAGITLPEAAPEPPPQPVGDYSALTNDIRQLQQSQGAKLAFVSSKPSDGLVLNTVDAASTFDDAQLAQFLRFAPYIVEANLARTAVTDASFDTLAKFSHLRAIHLEATAITGANLSRLAPLTQLTYLNLSQTKVTAAALASLKSIPNLRHIYLFDTPAQPASATDADQQPARSAQ